MRSKLLLIGLLLLLLVTACTDEDTADAPADDQAAPAAETDTETAAESAAEPAESAPPESENTPDDVEGDPTSAEALVINPTADHPLINEIAIGIDGNNNQEFIELYNPTNEAIDLNGWSLWHQIPTDENPLPLYRWESRTDLPARSYLLLVRQGEDVNVLADGYFDTALVNKGSLVLRNPEQEDVDLVGWGDAPEGGFVGSPAPAVENGQSLIRQAGELSQDNAADFTLATVPTPQNSGELVVLAGMVGDLNVILPENISPGDEIDLIFIIANNDTVEREIFLSLYIPEEYEPLNAGTELTAERRLEGSQIIPPNTSLPFELTVIAPLTHEETIFNGSYIEIDGVRRYAPISHISIAER